MVYLLLQSIFTPHPHRFDYILWTSRNVNDRIVTAWITEVVMIFGSVIKITFNCPIASSIVKDIPWDHIMFSDKDMKTDLLII